MISSADLIDSKAPNDFLNEDFFFVRPFFTEAVSLAMISSLLGVLRFSNSTIYPSTIVVLNSVVLICSNNIFCKKPSCP